MATLLLPHHPTNDATMYGHTRVTHSVRNANAFWLYQIHSLWFCSWSNFAAMCRRVMHTHQSCRTKTQLPQRHVCIVFDIDVAAFLTAAITMPQWKLIRIILNDSVLVCIMAIVSHAVVVFSRIIPHFSGRWCYCSLHFYFVILLRPQTRRCRWVVPRNAIKINLFIVSAWEEPPAMTNYVETPHTWQGRHGYGKILLFPLLCFGWHTTKTTRMLVCIRTWLRGKLNRRQVDAIEPNDFAMMLAACCKWRSFRCDRPSH